MLFLEVQMNKLSNCQKIGIGVLVTLLGAGITETPSINTLGYLVMLPGLCIFMSGFVALLDGKKSRHA